MGCRALDDLSLCPAPSDSCRAAICDPKSGCGEVVAADGTACGVTDECVAHACVAGTCREFRQPDGTACGTREECRPAGVCRQGACEQGPAYLREEWEYVFAADGSEWPVTAAASADGGRLHVLVTFANRPPPANELLTFDEGGVVVARVPTEATDVMLVRDSILLREQRTIEARDESFPARVRWRSVLHDELNGWAASTTGTLFVVASAPWVDAAPPLAFLRAFDVATGALRWERTLDAGTWLSSGTLRADEYGGAILTLDRDENGTFASRVESYAGDGALRWSREYSANGATALGGVVVKREYGPAGTSFLDVLSGAEVADFGLAVDALLTPAGVWLASFDESGPRAQPELDHRASATAPIDARFPSRYLSSAAVYEGLVPIAVHADGGLLVHRPFDGVERLVPGAPPVACALAKDGVLAATRTRLFGLDRQGGSTLLQAFSTSWVPETSGWWHYLWRGSPSGAFCPE